MATVFKRGNVTTFFAQIGIMTSRGAQYMKTSVLIAAAMLGAGVCSADWHLTALDEFQAQLRAFEGKMEALLCQREPKLQEFYKLWKPLRDASWRLERRALILKLEASPPDGGIVWENPWVWGGSIASSEAEELAAKDTVFAELRKETTRLGDAFWGRRDLLKLWNSAYKKAREECAASYEALQSALAEIQRKIPANKRIETNR